VIPARPTVVSLAAAALVAGVAVSLPHIPFAEAAAAVDAASGVAAAASVSAAATVEDEGAGCPAPALPDAGALPTNARLPDPFRKLDGSRITTTAEWTCRRNEIKKLAEKFVYGEKPPKPQTVSGTVSGSSITVNVSHQGRSSSFSASVSLPSGTGPFPTVVVLGGFGADTSTIRAAGAAVINYDPYSVGREGTPRTNKQGAFYSVYGNTSPTGLLAAWSWGVSRIIDVIEQSGGSILRADATGVTGCSRFGKGAFAVGAFDQRVALTMPIESGSAGVPIYRGIPGEGAQSLSSAYGEQPWLGDAFGSFTGSPGRLPVDTHSVVAMIAPRGLFVMDNPHIANLGPRSASVAALGGAEVYKALGAGSNITYWSDIQNGSHCAVRPEWTVPLQQHLRKYLLGTGNDPGAIRISSRAAGNLAEWRDWQTPTLGTSPSSPPPSPSPSPSDPPPSSPSPSPSSPSPSNPPQPGGCSATVSLNSWTGGFVATVKVTAGSSAITGWRVGLTLPAGATITNSWNVTRSATTGAVQFSNVAYNGQLAAGGATEFGFQATGSAGTPTATCTLP
jgi:hypothetical protein